MGIYLDLNGGALDVTGSDEAADVTFTFAAIMPTFRYFFPFESADLWLGAGVGPSLSTITGPVDEFSDDTVSVSRFNMLDTKIEIGAAFYLSQSLSIGLSIQNIFFVNGAGEVCVDATVDGVEEECEDIDSDSEAIDIMQIGVNLRSLF